MIRTLSINASKLFPSKTIRMGTLNKNILNNTMIRTFSDAKENTAPPTGPEKISDKISNGMSDEIPIKVHDKIPNIPDWTLDMDDKNVPHRNIPDRDAPEWTPDKNYGNCGSHNTVMNDGIHRHISADGNKYGLTLDQLEAVRSELRYDIKVHVKR